MILPNVWPSSLRGVVVATYIDNDHSFCFLEDVSMNCLPTNTSTIMFWFLYNTTGIDLEEKLREGVLKLIHDTSFCQNDKEYVLPENTPKEGICKSKA